jgi:gliding motility-associated-like protein
MRAIPLLTILCLLPTLLKAQCDIFPIAITDFVCDDNGTPSDPSDDTFSFNITMDGINVSATWETFINGVTYTGNYGVSEPIAGIPISIAPLTIGFRDVGNPNCVYNLFLDPGQGCMNPPCAVAAQFQNYICDDNGTPTDPTDDTFTVELLVNGVNTSQTWTSTGFINGSGTFGVPSTFGPFTVYTAVTGVQVFDDANSNCFDFATIFSPGACSNGCIINNAIAGTPTCNDNGTPGDPSDDFIEFTLLVVGNNVGSGFSLSTSDGVLNSTTGTYFTTQTFSISNFGSATTATITIVDNDDPNCTFDVTISLPANCGQQTCSLTDAGLTTIVCNDFGTPGIVSDDFLDITIDPQGSGLSGQYIITSPNAMATPGFANYGGPSTISLMGINVPPGATFPVTITDANDPNCFITIDIINDTPCITCSVTATIQNIICDDNGTSDPNDDTFTFEVNVNGVSVGASWTATDPNGTTGSYGGVTGFGPYLISGGGFTFDIIDIDDPNCSTTLSVTAPPPCSIPCSINATIQNIVCDDNGTSDPNDDTFTFEVDVDGVSVGASWTATDPNATSSSYGGVTVFGPYSISGGGFTFDIIDIDDPNCNTTLSVTAPPPCSIPCSINATIQNIVCDDNGTSDPNDDTFTFEVDVDGVSVGASWTATDPNATSSSYGGVTVFGPFLISGGGFTFDIIDIDDPNCSTTLSVTAPPSCSTPAPCSINASIQTVVCDDNGTSDPSDDTFTFEVDVNGISVGASWTATDPNSTSGSYGGVTQFGPFLISGGDFTFDITDIDDPNCSTTLSVSAPASCSTPEPCSINASIQNVVCDDNGTSDPSDDTFTFEVDVNGISVGASWTATDPNVTTGGYGGVTLFGPFLISGGGFTFDIIDIDDPNCSTTLSVTVPPSCSTPEPCSISASIQNVVCDDNGTSDPSDDTFTFEVDVDGVSVGTSWTATDPNGTTGSYNGTTIFGPYLISGGGFTFDIIDIDDPNCSTTLSVTAPASCSTPEPCSINASIQNVVCDDNGTSDPSDDTFTFEVDVNGVSVGASWTATDPNSTTGSYSGTTVFGPFLISGGGFTFDIIDIDDPNCSTTLSVTAPPSCSTPEPCSISASIQNVLCDDNGTSDPSDDTFTFEVDVNDVSVGASWTATDPNSTSGSYGGVTQFGPYLISGGGFTFDIIDNLDNSCLLGLSVQAPSECSDCPGPDTTFVNEVVCKIRDEGLVYINLIGQFGCDSIVGLNRIFSAELIESIDTSICFGDVFISSGGATFSDAQVIIDTIESMPCDVVRFIDLRIEEAVSEFILLELCQGEEVEFGGVIYNEDNPVGADTISSALGCDSLIRNIEIEYNTLNVFLEVNDPLCFGESSGSFTLLSDDPGLVSFPLRLITNGEEVIIQDLPYEVSNLSAGEFDIQLFDNNACQQLYTFSIEEGVLIEVELDGQEVFESSNSIRLEALSAQSDGVYDWTLFEGDTTCLNCPVFLSAPLDDFLFSVEISSEEGCSDSDTYQFIRQESGSTSIPNIFSPNGDFVNDIFIVNNTDPTISSMALSIYDRWGNLIFQSTDSERIEWDGRYDGNAVDPGVYIYSIQYENRDGSMTYKQGDITVVR